MNEPRLVFLLSAPYSGSTLLSILLNQHPEISSDGEIFPFSRGSNVNCSCGKDQIDCDYYRDVAVHMLKDGGNEWDFDLFNNLPKYSDNYYLSRAFGGFWLNPVGHRIRNSVCSSSAAFRRLEDDFITAQTKLFEKSLKRRNSSVYLDGTKSFRRAEFFLERKPINKILHLIRDGRAFCNSFLKNEKLSRRNLSAASRAWKKSIKKVDILKERFPHLQILEVRYDSLCAATENELSRIFDFLDLGYDDSCLVFNKEDMHILGNRMRNTYAGIIREDNSWKTELAGREIDILSSQMRKELERFNFLL